MHYVVLDTDVASQAIKRLDDPVAARLASRADRLPDDDRSKALFRQMGDRFRSLERLLPISCSRYD